MKYLLLAFLISLQALVSTDALAASSDQEQKQQKQDKAGEDDEPDCD